MIRVFFMWLYDKIINQTAYWYKEPPSWMNTELWGKDNYTHNPLTGTPIKMKAFGNKVTKKVCKSCKVKFWSNGKRNVCGRMACWNALFK